MLVRCISPVSVRELHLLLVVISNGTVKFDDYGCDRLMVLHDKVELLIS